MMIMAIVLVLKCTPQKVGCKVPWDTVTDTMERCTTAEQTE